MRWRIETIAGAGWRIWNRFRCFGRALGIRTAFYRWDVYVFASADKAGGERTSTRIAAEQSPAHERRRARRPLREKRTVPGWMPAVVQPLMTACSDPSRLTASLAFSEI